MTSKTADRAALERVARKIRFLLNNESLTVRNLAARIGVSREYLKDVVDAHARPTRHLLIKLCSVFNVKLEFFGPAALDFEFEEEVDGNGVGGGPRSASNAGVGVLPRSTPQVGRGKRGKKEESKKKRKFDLAELAAHHQALLDCLLEKRVFTADEYQKKLEEVRARARLV